MTEADSSVATPATPRSTSGGPVILFEDIHLSFEEGEVLSGLSFTLEPQETKVLLGEGGSGKTTVMKLAIGLLRPDSGRIQVLGRDVTGMSEEELFGFRRQVGFVFQEGALFDSMTVGQNVAFSLRDQGIADEEVARRVQQALEFVELGETTQKLPGELSGGMRRRVSIARALVSNPSLVFYDSPTAGLDPVTSQTIVSLILRGRDLQGVTALLATHRVQDAFGLADFAFEKTAGRVVRCGGNGAGAARRKTRVLVLRDGRVYFEGDVEELRTSSDEYLKKFLASAGGPGPM
jgi:phospholipid/cholesterol/gamma-HCH transport system ATP-binding protein